jgi:two-component system sensor histidine kinase TctE
MTEPQPPKAGTSLRSILLAWLLLPLALAVPVVAALQLIFVLRPAERALDHALENTALVMGQALRHDSSSNGVEFDLTADMERALRTDPVDTVLYLVLGPDGSLIAGDRVLLPLLPEIEPLRPAVGDTLLGDALLRDSMVMINRQQSGPPLRLRLALRAVDCGVPGALDAAPLAVCKVLVAETTAKRVRLRDTALLGAVLTWLAFAFLAAGVIWFGVRRGMRPLEQLRRQIASRSLGDLSPLSIDAVPVEVEPLAEGMNRLFERLGQAAAQQQAFIADAAHQLRTPLAALRADAELAEQQARASGADADLQATVARLAQSSARAARLAAQLLALARSESHAGASAAAAEPVDLQRLAREVGALWVPKALQQQADLGFELAPAQALAQAVPLQEALSNLIDNALAYARPPDGGAQRITLRSGVDGDWAYLEVQDNGPGIAADERPRVLERFYRGQAAREAGSVGSGLGLAIAAAACTRHGGRIELADAGDGDGSHGLRVRLLLPRAELPA